MGIDTVTFWTAPDKAGGCLLQFDQVYAVVAMTKHGSTEPVVGLLEMDPRVCNYIVQELQGRTLIEFDIDFVSDHHQIYGVFRKGGIGMADPAIVKGLNALEAQMHKEGVGQEITQAIRAKQRQLDGFFY